MQDTIRTLLEDTATWAVVGLSPDPQRDTHRIASPARRDGPLPGEQWPRLRRD